MFIILLLSDPPLPRKWVGGATTLDTNNYNYSEEREAGLILERQNKLNKESEVIGRKEAKVR